MKQQQKFLNSLLCQVTFSNERILEVINAAVNYNTDDFLRIVAYISGIENKPEIPESVNNDNYKITMSNYDIVKNNVYYKGVRKIIRYFKNASDASVYNDKHKNEIPSDVKYSSWKENDYQYEANIWCDTDSNMSLEQWLEQ